MTRRGADRWWRPTTNRRPPLRARQRQMYSEKDMGEVFDTAYTVGQGDERKRSRERDEWLRRVAEACDEGPDAVTALAREVGVMPDEHLVPENQMLEPSRSDVTDDISASLVDEVERWLRDQGE